MGVNRCFQVFCVGVQHDIRVTKTVVFRCAMIMFCVTSRVAMAVTFVFRYAVTEFCMTSRMAMTAAAAATSPDPHQRRCAAQGSSISLSQTSPAVELGERRQRVFLRAVNRSQRHF